MTRVSLEATIDTYLFESEDMNKMDMSIVSLTLSNHLTVRTPHKDRASLGYNHGVARESRLLFAGDPQLCNVKVTVAVIT